jgi:hypothetical protein
MDLTEPQAGSDLGNIVTRATREGDRYFIDGEKIFITNGGAQVHLVLARDADTFEQSKGTTNGLNLMLCPKMLPDGRPNGLRVARLESKLGIHGSPTCVIEFDRAAEAFLLATRGQGLPRHAGPDEQRPARGGGAGDRHRGAACTRPRATCRAARAVRRADHPAAAGQVDADAHARTSRPRARCSIGPRR